MTRFDNPIFFLATANAERARTFYEQPLGLRFVSDDPFALVFQLGHSMLRIQKVKHVSAAPYTALGWSVRDLRETVPALRDDHGVTFERYEGMGQDADGIWRSPSGAQIAWFRDPDVNVLSLTQPPK
jgi:catechol 2,3-dioxygenase-like lactoylglutathione lyase family enzyme